MSVQAGVVNFDGSPVSSEMLRKISRNLPAFGHDDEATVSDGCFGLLYRPFHTTKESRAERQPLTFGKGYALTWDGRLDNRGQLAAALGCSANDPDTTDISMVRAAFERWGTDCLKKLVGDWALALWNSSENDLILARDSIGVKHLFFCKTPERIVWCTELAALVLSVGKLTISDEYIAGYLAFYPDAHLTPYAEISSVPPGSFVRVRHGKATIHSYWRLNPDRRTHYKSDAEYEDNFRALLREAVRRRLRTDSPVLAGLSGGYDSTAIVFTVDDIIAREGAGVPRIDTFSYFDSNEPDDDDFIHVIEAEEKRGKAGFHCEMAGCGDSLCFEQEEFVAAPGFGLREEIKPALSEVVQRYGYRVGLSGLGGDEMNGQPLDCRVQAADLLVRLHVLNAARHLIAWSLATRIPWIQLFFGSVLEILPLPIRLAFATRAKLKSWVNRDFARAYGIAARQLEVVNGCRVWNPAARDAAQTLATLSRLVTHAPPSMLEQRYPYLDIDLVEFLASVPLDQLLRPGERRSLMRRSLAAVLPAATLTRKTKAAAARCYSLTLQKHWDKVDRLFKAPLSVRFGYVEGDLVRQELKAMKNGQVQADFTRLLKALSLEVWLRNACEHGILSVSAEGRFMTQSAPTFSDKQIDQCPQAMRLGNS